MHFYSCSFRVIRSVWSVILPKASVVLPNAPPFTFSAAIRIAPRRSPSICCLPTKATAPAASARSIVARSSCRLRITTAACGTRAASSRVAEMPSMTGRLTSIRTTSGDNRPARSTAVAPSAASPTTQISASSPRRINSPRSTFGSSSTSKTRIGSITQLVSPPAVVLESCLRRVGTPDLCPTRRLRQRSESHSRAALRALGMSKRVAIMAAGRSMTIRVLIADDHAVVRQGLRMFLALDAELEVVGEAEDGTQALSRAVELRPDVVLMDMLMPVMDGVAATEAIRGELPDTEVIALTSVLDDSSVVGAVKAAAGGQVQLAPQAAARLVRQVRTPDVAPTALSERETEVLQLIARGKANKEIAAELTIGEKTVKTHVSSILNKLGVQSRTQAALYAAQSGLVPLESG